MHLIHIIVVYVYKALYILLVNNCMYTMVLYEIGESNESVSLPSKSSGVRGGHHIGHVYI